MQIPRIIVLFILAGLLTACDSGQDQTTADDASSTASTAGAETSEAPTAAPPRQATAETDAEPAERQMPDLEGRPITIAVENAYLPFNYLPLDQDTAAGWDYDAWRAICELIRCTPEFIERPWIGTLQAVADGQVDTSGNGVSVTPERRETLQFSEPYFSSEQRLLARKSEERFSDADEFAADTSLRLGAQSGTTNYAVAVELVGEERVQSFGTLGDMVTALTAGEIPAVVIDQQAAPPSLGEPGDELEFIGDSLARDQLAFPFAQDSELVQAVNQALRALGEDGTLADLDQRYFSDDFDVTYDQIKLPEMDAVPYEQAGQVAEGMD